MLGSIYALIALGYTMVYGVLRLINFAHGDVFMVGAFVGLFTARALHPGSDQLSAIPVTGVEFLLMALVAMVGSAVLGLLIERIAYRPLRAAPRLTALITAIAVSMLLEYGGQIVLGTTPRTYPQFASSRDFSLGPTGISVPTIDLIILGVTIILVLILQFIVYRTKPGKAMRAVSHDREAASLMGINTDFIIVITFIIGSAFAGIAGVLVGMRNRTVEPMMGLTYGLKAFVAAVLGGIGSIRGAAIGGLVLGISEQIVRAIYPQLAEAVVFGLLILILVLKPTGLLGGGTVEKV
jgi:branched-chain amino acid transport system permease protein